MDATHDPRGELPLRRGREFLELWISLSRREWGSLVLIPADREGSTADIANALAEIGQRLSYEPVTAITVSSLEFGSALALADLQQHLDRERSMHRGVRPSNGAAPAPVNGSAVGGSAPEPAGEPRSEPGARGVDVGEAAPAEPGIAPDGAPTEALAVVPSARLLISIPPVVSEPLGLAAAHKADAVVLAVRINRSRMAEVRRTIDLVGRDRVIGCLLLR